MRSFYVKVLMTTNFVSPLDGSDSNKVAKLDGTWRLETQQDEPKAPSSFLSTQNVFQRAPSNQPIISQRERHVGFLCLRLLFCPWWCGVVVVVVAVSCVRRASEGRVYKTAGKFTFNFSHLCIFYRNYKSFKKR